MRCLLAGLLFLLISPFAQSAVPANDSFALAAVIGNLPSEISGNNSEANNESGDDPVANGYGTLWYSWTAPADGDVTVAVTSAGFAHTLSVYHGNALTALNLVERDIASSSTRRASLTFPARAGLSYRIVFGSNYGSTYYQTSGPFSFNISQPVQSPAWEFGPLPPTGPTPGNDTFAAAIGLSGAPIRVLGYNSSASVSPEPFEDPENTNQNGYRTLWYSWTAPADGDVTVSVTSAGFGHTLSVYHGNALTALNLVKRQSTSSGTQRASLTFPARAGLSYRIVFGSAYASSFLGEQIRGPFSFNISQPVQSPAWEFGPLPPTGPTPTNDTFAAAIGLSGASIRVLGYNTSASLSPEPFEEPENTNQNGYRTLWYSWTAPADGDVTVTVTSAGFGHTLSVYHGNSLNALNLVKRASTFSSTERASLTFPARAGLTYRIVFGSAYASSFLGEQIRGPFSFNISQPVQSPAWEFGPLQPTGPTPTNDTFAAAIALSGAPIRVLGYNSSASVSPEPFEDPQNTNQNGHRTLWYSWTAPADGDVTVTVTSAGFEHTLSVYRGDSLNSLNLVKRESTFLSTQRASLKFPARKGLTYRIVFGSTYSSTYSRTSGPFGLSIEARNPIAFRNAKGNYRGILRDASMRTALVSLSVAANRSFSGQIRLGTLVIPLKGVLDLYGVYNAVLRLPGSNETVSVQLNVPSGADISSGATVSLVGNGLFGSASTNLLRVTVDPSIRQGVQGRYTMALTTNEGAGIPEGAGYAIVNLRPNGDASVTGRLGDGQAFSTSTFVTKNADVIFHATPYPKGGVFQGALTVNGGAQPASISGTLEWIKAPQAGPKYPAGFSTTVSVEGTEYTPPAAGQLPLDLQKLPNNASAFITGGDLPVAITKTLTISANGTSIVTDPGITGLKLVLSPKTGMFTGSFTDRVGGRKMSMSGVLITGRNHGVGHFVGANKTGKVEIK